MFDTTVVKIIAALTIISTISSLYVNLRKEKSFYGDLLSWLSSCFLILLSYIMITSLPYKNFIFAIAIIPLVGTIYIIYRKKTRNYYDAD